MGIGSLPGGGGGSSGRVVLTTNPSLSLKFKKGRAIPLLPLHCFTAGYRVNFRQNTSHRVLTYTPKTNVHSRHPVPCANGNMVHYSSVRENIDGKFSLLVLEVKVHKTGLNTGYTTSGTTYCSTVAQFGCKHLSPFEHCLPARSTRKQNIYILFVSLCSNLMHMWMK
jgi:hypothetical protein